MSHDARVRYLPPGDPASRLDADRRRRDLDALARHGSVDVVVIGGGITGAGVALDAATRGLSVVLLERHDLAFGTSRWSSKLVHGGLRYLAKGDVGIAWESAVERATIGGVIAPHLVRPLAQVLPIYDDARVHGALTRVGYLAADSLRVAAGHRSVVHRARTVGVDEALRLAPAVRRRGLLGAVVGEDLQLVDDARLVVAVARTAAAYGARILTGMDVVSASADGVVELRDVTTGDTSVLHGRHVVNATGVWASELDPSIALEPSRGTHLVLASSSLGMSQASLTIEVERGRAVFTLPQLDGLTFVGLTDDPQAGPVPDVAEPTEEDIDWILSVLNSAVEVPIDRADVLGSFAGLRPLLAAASSETEGVPGTADLSRRHAVRTNGRLLTVAGGKLTAYRRMAQDVVDLITERPCQTTRVALVGAGPGGRPEQHADRLVARYGAEAPLVASMAEAVAELAQPVVPGLGVRGVELAFGLAWEGARSTDDLLERRTRLSLVPAHAAAARPLAERLVDAVGTGLTTGAGYSGGASK
ncbi:MAG: glycerol-3-phosphate dehydrogenase/oxidase [Jiangellales bacterium]